MDRLKYMHTSSMYEGIIVEISGGAVVIDLKGRMGQLKVPKRMLISENTPQVGHEVGFMLSYPEVINEEVNQDYLNIIEFNKTKRREQNED
jgi:hypothetical protein